MATPEETKETMQTETTSDNEVKETVEETTTETAVENDEATFDTIKKELEAQKELLQQSEDHIKDCKLILQTSVVAMKKNVKNYLV